MEDPQYIEIDPRDFLQAEAQGHLEKGKNALGEMRLIGQQIRQKRGIIEVDPSELMTARDEAVMRDTGVDLKTARKFGQSRAAQSVTSLPPDIPTRVAPPVDQVAAQYEVLKRSGNLSKLSAEDYATFTAPLKAAGWEVGADYIKPPSAQPGQFPLWERQLAQGETAEAPKTPQAWYEKSAPGRFVRSVFEPIGGTIEEVAKLGFDALTGKSVLASKRVYNMLAAPQVEEYKKAQALAKERGYKDGRAALADPEIAGHFAATFTPFVGPMAAHAGEQFGSGDVAGGLGTSAVLFAPFVGKAVKGRLGRTGGAQGMKNLDSLIKEVDNAEKVQPKNAEVVTETKLPETAKEGEVVEPTPPVRTEAEAVKGEIIDVYHGSRDKSVTAENIEVRDPGYSGNLGKGIYFGQNRATAEYYGPHVTETKVRVKNPLLIDPNESLQTVNGKLSPRLEVFAEDESGLPSGSILAGEDLPPFDVYSAKGNKYEVRDAYDLKGLRDWAESEGHDAIIMRDMRPSGGGEEILIFDKSQIVKPTAKVPVSEPSVKEATNDTQQLPIKSGSKPTASPVETPKGEIPQAAPKAETAPKEVGERSFPKTAKAAGLPEGKDLTYEIVRNESAIEMADKNISEKGIDGAIEFVKASEPSAESTATGLAAIRKLQDAGDYTRAGDLVDTLAAKLTQQGQAIQAVKVIENYAPERVVLTAQQMLDKAGKGKRLTADQVAQFTKLGEELQAATNKVRDLELRVAELEAPRTKKIGAARQKLESWQVKLDNAANEARMRLKERTERGPLGPEAGEAPIIADIADYAVIGAAKLASKGIDFAKWTAEMTAEFGDQIKPHLDRIYRASFEQYKAAQGEAREAGKVRRAIGTFEQGPPTPAELKTAIAQRDLAIKRQAASRRELARQYQMLDPKSFWLRNISSIRKAGMLTSPKTWARNISGNAAMQIMDEAARAPAVIADTLASAVTGKRSISGPSPVALFDSMLAGIREGGKGAMEIMKNGATAEQMRNLQFPNEVNTGVKIVDTATNSVFRFMAAQDKVFYEAAYRRNLLDRARIEAKNTGKSAKELIANPPEELAASAKHDALVATFQNNNKLSDFIQRGRSALGPTANFAIDMVLPFDRTPTNIMARILEASPIGFGKNAVQLGKAIIDKAMTVEEQRAFSQTFGRATVGTGLMLLGYKLAAKGVLTGPASDDASVRAKQKAHGAAPLSAKVGNKWVEVGRMSPAGNLLTIGAGLYEESHREHGKPVAVIGKALTEQPILRATSQLTEAAKSPERKAEQFGASLAGSFVPASAVVRDIATLTDKEKARYPNSFAERVKMGVPGLRQQVRTLPSDERIKDMSFNEVAALYRQANAENRKKLQDILREKLRRAKARKGADKNALQRTYDAVQ